MEREPFLVVKFVNIKPKVAKVLGFLIPFLDCNFLFATFLYGGPFCPLNHLSSYPKLQPQYLQGQEREVQSLPVSLSPGGGRQNSSGCRGERIGHRLSPI
jgi:hypothetical protein